MVDSLAMFNDFSNENKFDPIEANNEDRSDKNLNKVMISVLLALILVTILIIIIKRAK